MHQLLRKSIRGDRKSPLFVYINLTMELAERIKKASEAKLTSPDHFVVDVIISKHKPTKVTIVLDGDHGITIDDCSTLSRSISAEMEEGNWIKDEAYTLEVGTPGLDHPLKLTRQYHKNIGRGLSVHVRNKEKIQGQLISVEDGSINLAVEAKEGKKINIVPTKILFTEIEKALVMVSFKK